MVINDERKAEHYIERIGYYRLSAYMYPFLKMPRRISHPWITLSVDPQRTYFNICIIKYLLGVISPNNDMLAKLRWLFVTFPEIDLAAMGFPKGWELEPIWK